MMSDAGDAAAMPGAAPDATWLDQFEVRIREVASRAVAHIKRGDWVNVRTTGGESVSGNGSVGADPVLRFLALIEPSPKGSKAKPGLPVRTGSAEERAEPLAAVLAAAPIRSSAEAARPAAEAVPRARAEAVPVGNIASRVRS